LASEQILVVLAALRKVEHVLRHCPAPLCAYPVRTIARLVTRSLVSSAVVPPRPLSDQSSRGLARQAVTLAVTAGDLRFHRDCDVMHSTRTGTYLTGPDERRNGVPQHHRCIRQGNSVGGFGFARLGPAGRTAG